MLHSAFLLNGERAIFVNREKRLIRLQLREDFLDGIHFNSVLRVVAGENYAGVPPLPAGFFDDCVNNVTAHWVSLLADYPLKVSHSPSGPVDAISTGRRVQQGEHRAFVGIYLRFLVTPRPLGKELFGERSVDLILFCGGLWGTLV